MSDAKEIAVELAAILDERRKVAEDEHSEHHEFLRQLIDEHRRKREMYEDLRRHLTKWGAVGILSFIGMAVWYWLRNHIGTP